MKTNKLDSFEQFVNETLSSEEVAYNPSDWSQMSQKLDAVSPKPFYKNNWFLGGAAVVVLGIGTIAFNYNSKTENKATNNIVETEVKDIQPKENKEFNENVETLTVVNEEQEEFNELTITQSINKNTSSETIEKKKKEGNNVKGNHQTPQNALLPETSSNDMNSNDEENKPEDQLIVIPNSIYTTTTSLIGCKGLTVGFEAKRQENVKYLWSFGDGTFSNDLAPKHEYKNSGKFNVELIVQSTLDDKIMRKSASEQVVIHEDPIVEIVTDKEMNRGLTTVHCSTVGEELNKVFWNFGNGQSSNKKETEATYKKRGTYTILLEAENAYGCKSITKQNLFIEDDYNLLAPNAFTPDGDGLNDVFIPEALKTMDCNFTMVIRSRTEGIVFESTSIDRPWDGKNQQNGADCQETNYVWVVNLINKLGEKEQYSGTILIRR